MGHAVCLVRDDIVCTRKQRYDNIVTVNILVSSNIFGDSEVNTRFLVDKTNSK